MKNADALDFFRNMARKQDFNVNSVKLAHNSDYTHIDAEFILKYANASSSILDIGSGTGLIINKIYDKVKSIECVEPFKKFSDFITESLNITINNSNIFDFKTSKIFDVITLFGIMPYFSEEEAVSIYKKCYALLKKEGTIIIKNQFCVKDTVEVAGYSEENKADYYSQYRSIAKETDILTNIGFQDIKVYDIYPKEANRWDNTHFYALVATKS